MHTDLDGDAMAARTVVDPAEALVREALAAGRTTEAVATALEAHGPAVFGFVVERLRSAHRAREVYSQFQEDLVRGLATFEGRCALKTWLFAVARRALARNLRDEGRRRRRERAWEVAGGEPAVAPRDETPPYRRTTMKDRIRVLRRDLDDDEQLLLYLRIDQQMPWLEVAVAMAEDEALASADSQKRVAARLRRRFTDLTAKLRRMAESEGLLDGLD